MIEETINIFKSFNENVLAPISFAFLYTKKTQASSFENP
jgi:hypothetical protein